MKILVTGGAGYLGSALVNMLLTGGHRVRVLDNLTHGGQPLLGAWSHPSFEFVGGDIRDATVADTALKGMEAVVHLAAIVGDPACAREPELTREVNLDASLQLFRAAGSRGAGRFIFASTCSNYGKMVDSSGFVTEESELLPVSLYAETKVAVENAILSEPVHNGPAVTILRLSTLFGLAPRVRLDLTVNEFAMELFTKRHLVVFGEQFWRPYVHVRDAARAVEMVLEAPEDRVSGQVFNVGSTSENYRKGQIVDMIREQIVDETEIERVHRTEDPRDYRVSFEKIANVLGFDVTRTVKDGIREIIDAIDQGVVTDFENPAYRN